MFMLSSSILTSPIFLTVVLGFVAGFAGTVGGFAARFTTVTRSRHDFISAFGAGALIGAVGLVLIPHGVENLPLWLAVLTFLGGGLVALALEQLTTKKAEAKTGGTSTFAAMMLDFLPEALVVGALIPVDRMQAIIVTIIIIAQNGPEGFAAFSEMAEEGDRKSRRKALWLLSTLPIIGILAVGFGLWLCEIDDAALGLIMAGASGGILYLVFKTIIPEAHDENDGPWPSFGGILGFGVALLGYGLTVH